MIRSFGSKATLDLYHGIRSKETRRLPIEVQKRALVKLDMIDAAETVDDLRVPPGNRLEALKGELAGFFSIRINNQWRIIFRFNDRLVDDVKIIDYH